MTDIEGGLITLEYAREGLNWKSPVGSVASEDADLISYVQAATGVIEGIVGPVLPVSVTKRFDGGGVAVVLPSRVDTVTSVTESGEAVTDYFVDADAGLLYAGTYDSLRSFTPGVLNVEVVYTTGFSEVPATIQLAARELVKHWWQAGKQSNRPAFGEEPQPVNLPLGVPSKRIGELLAPYAQIPGFI